MKNASKLLSIEVLPPGLGREITAIHRDTFPDEVLKYSIYRSDKIHHYVDRLLCHDSHEFLGAFDRGSLTCYAHVHYQLTEAHLNYIAVCDRHQRSGLGDRLLGNVIERACNRNAKLLSLHVQEKNQAVQLWYRRHGFEVAGEFSLYLADPEQDCKLSAADVDLSSSHNEQTKHETFGFSQLRVRVHDAEYAVGQIGDSLFNVSGRHDVQLVAALHALDPGREILLRVSDEAPLACAAELHDHVLRMVRRL